MKEAPSAFGVSVQIAIYLCPIFCAHLFLSDYR